MYNRLIGAVCFLLCIAIISFAQSAKEIERLKELNLQQNIVYKIVDGDTLDMIIFFPKEKVKSKMPVMLYTHGGGWGGGDKLNVMGRPFFGTLKTMLDNGIACATIEYRLTRVGKSTVLDCVTDCKDAARFLMKNAEKYGFDVGRMGVWGGSAGGHLSLMTALADDKYFKGDESLQKYSPHFLCVVSFYPLTSFIKQENLEDSNFEKPERYIPLLGGLLSENLELAKKLSPVEWIGKNSPPVFLLHGEDDKVLPIAQSTYLEEVGKERGADVQLLKVKNAGHSFNGENISPSIEDINKLAARYIIEKLTTEKK
jgi:acetyl esterase/lipase